VQGGGGDAVGLALRGGVHEIRRGVPDAEVYEVAVCQGTILA
jgi:hypothetical protein